jgi:hypothetical protein
MEMLRWHMHMMTTSRATPRINSKPQIKEAKTSRAMARASKGGGWKDQQG